ncbi:MAG: AAA family ATPase [Cyclobacteriaceae bacterium]|nr:AAA family ATPase [Cyclobacteriaceae bacterium]
MRIDQLHLENFRGYESVDFTFDKHFNLIIGANGSGKTALLEALTISMGSFFLGIRNTDSRHIHPHDVHYQGYESSVEHRFPTIVKADGVVQDKSITWQRELTGFKSKTLFRSALGIKEIAIEIDKKIRNGDTSIILPALAYYATGRLFIEAANTKFQNTTNGEKGRFRSYKNCLQAKSTFKHFAQWYKTKELAEIQKKQKSQALAVIKKAIIDNIPGCQNIFYEFDPDMVSGLIIEMGNNRTLPFEYLSDGTRNYLALIADLAFKCVTLNPQLEGEALLETPGVVLIDELDLHLHPEWQRKIIKSLQKTFPKIQFFATTHSPFLIQEVQRNQLIKLDTDNIVDGLGGDDLSIEDIAENIQGVPNPQWSTKKQELYDFAKEYYKSLKEGKSSIGKMEIKLAKKLKPFSQNPAFDAFIEQIRLSEKNIDEAS